MMEGAHRGAEIVLPVLIRRQLIYILGGCLCEWEEEGVGPRKGERKGRADGYI